MLSFCPKFPYPGIRSASLLKAKTIRRAVPSWYSSANSSEWTTVPGSSLSASGVMQSGDDIFINAWGGGIVNTTGVYSGTTFIPGTFFILFGGGHSDSSSNAVYACGPLEDETPAWYRLRDRTSSPPTNVSEDGSGNPVSRHTYQSISYVGGAKNWLFCSGGLARYSDANGIAVAHVFQFNTSDPNTNQPWTTKTAPPAAADVSAYDSSTGRIWSHPDAANEVQYYDVSADSWTRVLFKSPGWATGSACSAIDTSRGIWAIYYSTGLNFFRTNDINANDYYAPSTTGTAPTGAGSIIYDPVADVYRVWNGNGKQIFTLTAPGSSPYQGGNSWTWSSATPAGGSTPSAAATNGTFGRFAYVNNGSMRGYLLLNSATGSFYFYKP